MRTEYIKDRKNRIIGIQNGNILMDGRSRIVARYIPATDTTVSREGKIVGKGNQLLRMLPPSDTK